MNQKIIKIILFLACCLWANDYHSLKDMRAYATLNPNDSEKRFFIPVPDFYDPVKALTSSVSWTVKSDVFSESYWIGNFLYRKDCFQPEGKFTCKYANNGIRENGVFVDRCSHSEQASCTNELLLSATSVDQLKPGKQYYIKGVTYSDGTPFLERGGSISWVKPIETDRKVISYRGIQISQITYSTISCTIYSVNDDYGYTTIDDCKFNFDHNEFESIDDSVELYRKNGTLKFTGYVESGRVLKKEDIQIKGNCMSNDGMRIVKKVNRADVCK